ncbi:MAG: CidA/LrgA family protein [Lachnospiraceae bacterium]|nr:CidA/LrgA family protein [Lachnospiraceae bacterium]
MKYVKQFMIILLVALAAEALEVLLPLPIPASIYGLFIMLLLLLSGLLKAEAVKDASGFLVEIMPLMFIPAAVGLMESYVELQGILLPMLTAVAVTTVVVMAVTGRCAQAIAGRGRKEKDADQ